MNYLDYTRQIPMGRKGWYASEMQTWSKEKMQNVLKQYGKNGLTENTYKYLIKRVGQSSNPPVSPTYYADKVINAQKSPDAGLMFNATNLGVKGAYTMTSDEQLNQAIEQQEKVNAKNQAAYDAKRKQQAAYEDYWARKNYKAITGQDWRAGIDLSNYTLKAVAAKQQQIGLTGKAVDGKWGSATQKAYDTYIANNGKEPDAPAVESKLSQAEQDYLNSDIYKQMMSDEKFQKWLYERGASQSPIANGITTGTAAAKAKTINWFSKTLGIPINGATKRDASEGIKNQLLAQALYMRSFDENHDSNLRNNGVTKYDTNADGLKYEVHRHFNGNHYVNESDRNVIDRASDNPVEHFLGRYSVTETPTEFIFSDRYDFNQEDNDVKGDGWYARMRRSMGQDQQAGTGYDVRIAVPKQQLNSLYLDYLKGEQANKYPLKTQVRNWMYEQAERPGVKNIVSGMFGGEKA